MGNIIINLSRKIKQHISFCFCISHKIGTLKVNKEHLMQQNVIRPLTTQIMSNFPFVSLEKYEVI